MSASERKEFYRLIVEAQKSDAEGKLVDAFGQYLDGISALTSYLKQTRTETIQTPNVDAQLLNGVNTLKLCVDRLQQICTNGPPDNDKANEPQKNNGKVVIKIPQQALAFTNSLSPVVGSPKVSVALSKAYKENALLTRIFNNRLRTVSDPRKKASLQLELQRRLAENIQLARVKETEKYHEEHLRERKALEEAAKKLVQQQQLLNIDSDSMLNKQHLYGQILQYELSLGSRVNQFRCNSLNPDAKVVNDIVASIICLKEHPLCVWMKKFQYQIQNHIEPLLSTYITQRCIREQKNLLDADPEELFDNSEDRFGTELVIDQLEAEALERHFNNIASDLVSVHETLTLMLTLILFDDSKYYQPVNSHSLQQQQLLMQSVVADFLYPPIWAPLSSLFRVVYHQHELALHKSMHEKFLFMELESEWSSVPPDVISAAADALKSIIPLQSPHAKLQAMVRLVARLCDQLKSLGISNNQSSSLEVGADELIPVLCLVVLKSAAPQLIAECLAIEQLVDGKYLLGEEGYCLSSVQTALKYIEMNTPAS